MGCSQFSWLTPLRPARPILYLEPPPLLPTDFPAPFRGKTVPPCRSPPLGQRKDSMSSAASRSIFPHRETIFLCGASGAGKTTPPLHARGLRAGPRNRGPSALRASDPLLRRQATTAGAPPKRNERSAFIFQGYFPASPSLASLVGKNALLPSPSRSPNHCRGETLWPKFALLRIACTIVPAEPLPAAEQQKTWSAICPAALPDRAEASNFPADEPTGNLRIPHRRHPHGTS